MIKTQKRASAKNVLKNKQENPTPCSLKPFPLDFRQWFHLKMCFNNYETRKHIWQGIQFNFDHNIQVGGNFIMFEKAL